MKWLFFYIRAKLRRWLKPDWVFKPMTELELQIELGLNRRSKKFGPRLGQRVLEFGETSWGDHVKSMTTDPTDVWGFPFKIWGHKPQRPREGDQLEMEMQSGRTLVGTLLDLHFPTDPDDMFFADVYWHTVKEPKDA